MFSLCRRKSEYHQRQSKATPHRRTTFVTLLTQWKPQCPPFSQGYRFLTKMKALWRPPADYYMDMHSIGMEKTYIKNKWQKVAGQTLWGDGYSISIPMVLTWVYLVKYLSCTLECGFYVLYAVCALSQWGREGLNEKFLLAHTQRIFSSLHPWI